MTVGMRSSTASLVDRLAGDLDSAFPDLVVAHQDGIYGALPAAYLDAMDADMPAHLAMKPEDAETAASFADTALRLRSVIDLAEEANADKAGGQRTAAAAREATFRVIDLMARLDTPSMTAAIFR